MNIALYIKNIEIIYFDSFRVGHVHKNIKANIFRIQANNLIMCGYFSIGFSDFMVAGKTLFDYTSLFSLMILKKSDNITLSYFNKRINSIPLKQLIHILVWVIKQNVD